VADDVAANPQAQATVQAGAEDAASGVQGAVTSAQEQLDNLTPAQVEQAAQNASRAAWSALLALGLSAFAAIAGGLAGTRTMPTDIVTIRRPEDART
jgi:hypothetical protein